MNTITKSIVAALAITLMAACSKDNATPPAQPADNTATFLMAGAWKITGNTVSPALNGITDVYALLPGCETDNLLLFKPAGKFEFDQGVMKCDASVAQSDEGAWSYESATKKLDYNSPLLHSYSITVTSCTATKMVGYYQQIMSGITYTITGTFTRQ